MTAASRTLVQTLAQLTPEQVELRDDFIRCCRDTRQTMPARWLYDHRGSELFEEITTLTEYYPTRTELALLRELILAAMALPLPYDEQGRDGRLVQLLLDEIQRMPSLALSLPEPLSPPLLRLCRALRAQPDDERSLQEWARTLAMDSRTLQRRFVRETGLTVGQWRRQCRLLLACERLARGESVLEVALALGYASPSAFSAMFKRELGVPPSLFYK